MTDKSFYEMIPKTGLEVTLIEDQVEYVPRVER